VGWKIDSGKAAQRRRLIECLFHAGVGEIKPLLQKVSPQHDRKTNRLPSVARPGVMKLDQRQLRTPRHYLLHLIEKQLPLALAAMLFKTRLGCQCLLKARLSFHASILFKQGAVRRLVQRFPSRWEGEA
jgi:hypothetical protein